MTAAMPAWISSGSSVAQYLASRNSSTNQGTFVPFLIWCSRSLRTTQPANARLSFSSSVSIVLFQIIGLEPQRFPAGHPRFGIINTHFECASKTLLQPQRQLDRLPRFYPQKPCRRMHVLTGGRLSDD